MTTDDENDVGIPPGDEYSETDEYDVGYGKPPKETRFKCGQSGNPRGRPRGSKDRKAIIKEIANERHTVKENGEPRRLTTLELVMLTLRNKAAEGDIRAIRSYEAYRAKYAPDENDGTGYLVVPAAKSQEEWIKEQMELNKTRERPGAKRQKD